MLPLALLTCLMPPADHAADLNAKLSEGVTPENNAAVALLKAFGPTPEGGDGPPDAFFKMLGAPRPPKDGDYFVGIEKFAKTTLKLDDPAKIYEQQSQASERPWTAKEFPDVAKWLRANEAPLAVVAEAVKRPRYYHPIVPGQNGTLIGALMHYIQSPRQVAAALTARAMLRISENKPAEAWADSMTCHRLGAHVGTGGTIITSLVGYAIEQIAGRAEATFAEHAKLAADEWRGKIKEFDGLPPVALLDRAIGVGERAVGLDGMKELGQIGTPEYLAAVEERLNAYYDRAAAAAKLPTRSARREAFAAVNKDYIEKRDPKKPDPRTVPVRVADTLIGLLAPVLEKSADARDRTEQARHNTRLALALAAYKADAKKYPAKLAELAPKYLDEVRPDLFSGRPLFYEAKAGGYMIYSVGPNGKDDAGRSRDDAPPGDDLAIRVPAPKE